MALLPPSNRMPPARIFISKDGRAHVILNKESVQILLANSFPVKGYVYPEIAGDMLCLKRQQHDNPQPRLGAEAKESDSSNNDTECEREGASTSAKSESAKISVSGEGTR